MKRLILILLMMTIFLTGCSKTEEGNPIVVISIEDYGDISVELYKDVAPITVENFISYVEDGAYDGSTFHRIIENFMIQGGIVDDTRDAIQGEFSSNGVTNDLSHTRGVISMARTSIKDSATSQFFIVHQDSTFLDGDYAAFGMMIDGFDVLDQIAAVSTNVYDAPLTEVTITSISIAS